MFFVVVAPIASMLMGKWLREMSNYTAGVIWSWTVLKHAHQTQAVFFIDRLNKLGLKCVRSRNSISETLSNISPNCRNNFLPRKSEEIKSNKIHFLKKMILFLYLSEIYFEMFIRIKWYILMVLIIPYNIDLKNWNAILEN